ncbi:MAG: hypothetical protein Q4F95_09685 [Oscillospiraceae bacterium]|nr:hypothetical protein [Oscillospiraceae bacterium]
MKKKSAIFITIGLVLMALGVFIICLFTKKTKKVPCDTFLSIGIYALAGFIGIIGIVISIVGIKSLSDGNILDTEGIFTEGEIIQTKQDNGITYANIKYTDSEHNVQYLEECFYSGSHRPGDKVAMKYAKCKNGKYTAQVLDRG